MCAPTRHVTARYIAFRYGALFGLGIGCGVLLLVACVPWPDLLVWMMLMVVLWMVGVFGIGMLSTNATAEATTGVAAGFWVGAVDAVMSIMVIVYLLYRYHEPLFNARQTSIKAWGLEFTMLYGLPLLWLFLTVLGSLLGALGGHSALRGMRLPKEQAPVAVPPLKGMSVMSLLTGIIGAIALVLSLFVTSINIWLVCASLLIAFAGSVIVIVIEQQHSWKGWAYAGLYLSLLVALLALLRLVAWLLIFMHVLLGF
ncbi:hypothetical protein [Dictyobacter aurantiacus]|uniref:Uncharacterized protein n=1 Tax=Dictyobacter aurantiacus TaxID=1936993 RepID=A0A401ZKZ8_9CHLR|nr:hypothetical protein [Dictyobacter aurantiacus]GCE07523.1 hypothetical protein KDAU_48520 [Dictyobacter aurantiacus]